MVVKTERKAIQAAIIAVLATVATVENVYDDRPNPQTTTEIRSKWLDSSRENLHEWWVQRVSSVSMSAQGRGKQIVVNRHEVWYRHEFDVFFRFSYRAEASDTIFQDIVDDVLDAFKDQRSLGGFNTFDPLTLLRIDEDPLGDTYGHRAHFRVDVIAREAGIVPT